MVLCYSLHFTDADNDMKINKYKSDYGEKLFVPIMRLFRLTILIQ